MNRVRWWMASATLAVELLLSMTSAPVQAALYKVNCDAVMQEFRKGKEPRQIASDLNLHENSVHRCLRAAARAQRRSQPTAAPTVKR
jgi:DNA-binding NarL/FixJ family response regulator